MHNAESPLNHIRFVAVPYNVQKSTSVYSDIIACSTKLMHFVAKRNSKEFVRPSRSVFNEIAAESMTSVARSLVRYDLSQGQFLHTYMDIWPSDISAMCLDEERGRRIYLGFADGAVVLMNYMNGEFIETVEGHMGAKEVSALASYQNNGRNRLYVGSADGRLRTYDESGGNLSFSATIEVRIRVSICLHLCMYI